MNMSEWTGAARRGEPLRRVAWRRALDDKAIEFCALERLADGLAITGRIVAAAGGLPAIVAYKSMYPEDSTRPFSLTLHCVLGGEENNLCLVRDSNGSWLKDGTSAPDLDGCSDADLEWSPSTNLSPIRRLAPAPGARLEVRAAWVRMPSLAVEPSRQSYERLGSGGALYRNEASGFEAEIDVDEVGLPISYAGVWTRIGDWRSI